LVPALLTSTDTFSCSVSMYSSAILDISGYTVPEPSMTILPSSAPLFSFSSEDPPFCDSFSVLASEFPHVTRTDATILNMHTNVILFNFIVYVLPNFFMIYLPYTSHCNPYVLRNYE